MAGYSALISKGLLPLMAGSAFSLASPDKAEGGWRPWRDRLPILPWMDQLWDILEHKKFYEPFINGDMLKPEVAERMAKAAFSDAVPGNIRIPQEQLAHIYSRRIYDEGKSVGDVVRMFGRTFGDANAQASPQLGKKFPVLTSLPPYRRTGALFPYEIENGDAVLHSGMIKNPADIRRIRENGAALQEGRRGLHHAQDPSFSLDGNAAYDTQLRRLSDVSNADVKIVGDGIVDVNRKRMLPIVAGSAATGAALAPGEAFSREIEGYAPGSMLDYMAHAGTSGQPGQPVFPADRPGYVNPEPPLGTPLVDPVDIFTAGIGVSGKAAKAAAMASEPAASWLMDKAFGGLLGYLQREKKKNGGGGI